MKKYLIVADDFTGSNDTGMQLARKGLKTCVTLKSEVKETNASYVIDTESRSLTAQQAYEKVSLQVAPINLNGFDCVIKKVDSTLRGNIYSEIEAIDDKFNSDLIIFMPALPDLGRTTENGVHKLNGVRITETELANDPKTPVKEDDIRNILSNITDEKVSFVPLKDIRDNKIDISSKYVACDAKTNEDMCNVIAHVEKLGKKVLWVGTAAIADNLLAQEVKTKPSLALVASVSDVTRKQVAFAEGKGVKKVVVPGSDLITNKPLDKYRDEAIKCLKSNHDVMIVSDATVDRAKLDETIEIAKANNVPMSDVSDIVQNTLGDLTKQVLENVEVSGMFVSGGDTAIGLFDKIKTIGTKVKGEILIGVPIMELIGGAFDGLKVITKAGAFGNEDALFFSLRKLKDA